MTSTTTRLCLLMLLTISMLLLASGCGTNPPLLDSDGDGFTDQEEVAFTPGTNPNDPTDNPDNVRDTDGDGCSDYDELTFDGMCDNDPNTQPQTAFDRITPELRAACSFMTEAEIAAQLTIFQEVKDQGGTLESCILSLMNSECGQMLSCSTCMLAVCDLIYTSP